MKIGERDLYPRFSTPDGWERLGDIPLEVAIPLLVLRCPDTQITEARETVRDLSEGKATTVWTNHLAIVFCTFPRILAVYKHNAEIWLIAKRQSS